MWSLAIIVPVCLFVLNLLWFVQQARTWKHAPALLGHWRRWRDKVRPDDLVAAAQAASLAGEVQVAEELFGRYSLDLCPNCGKRPPLYASTWARATTDETGTYRYVCIYVCGLCWSTPPNGWQPITQGSQHRTERADRRVRHMKARFEQQREQLYTAIARTDAQFTRARARFDRVCARYEQRLARFRRRFQNRN